MTFASVLGAAIPPDLRSDRQNHSIVAVHSYQSENALRMVGEKQNEAMQRDVIVCDLASISGDCDRRNSYMDLCDVAASPSWLELASIISALARWLRPLT